jgi:hypothetical protein
MKPCPFCRETETLLCRGEVGKVYWVKCKNCKAEGPTSLYGESQAKELWNERFELKVDEEEMNLKKIIDVWNKQADEYNQWPDLGEDEKVEFAFRLGVSKQKG